MSIRSHTSVAVDSTAIGYGMVSTLPVSGPRGADDSRSKDFFWKLKFVVGEITGLLFIVFSALYIFGKPAWITQTGVLKDVTNRFVKRAIDIVGASVGLLLTLPLMAVIAVLVKLDSPGPVFYTQVRVGVNRRKHRPLQHKRVGVNQKLKRDRRREDHFGRPFRVVKFRTMIQNAEKATGPVWAVKNDSRITRLGAFMRKARLDEIPQFWNILRGDMSLVGPRPERPSFVRDLQHQVNDYNRRLDVKPGLTGLAQVENGYDSSVASVVEKVRFDLQYIRGWSVWSDVRILLKTVVVVVTGKGAC